MEYSLWNKEIVNCLSILGVEGKHQEKMDWIGHSISAMQGCWLDQHVRFSKKEYL